MGSPGAGHEGGLAYCLVLSSSFVFFSITFFFCLEKCCTVAKKGFVTVVANTISCVRIVCFNLLFQRVYIPLAGGWAGKKNKWALFYIFIDAAFSMGWDYAERMLYFLLGCSLWIKAFWCLLSSYSPCVHALKLGTQSL